MFEVLSESELDLKGKIQFYFNAFFEGVRDIGPNGERDFIIEPVVLNYDTSKFGIQKVDVKINGDSVKLKVTLLRPGIFIGKKAEQINALMTYLSTNIGKNVAIAVHECKYDPWGTTLNKNYLNRDEMIKLFTKAKNASEKTYSPFSKFPVGAAVLTKDGKIYTGSNVENSSYGLTICAERTALSHMVGTGIRDIKAIAVYGTVESLSPCGACRQFIYEFGKDIVVVFLDEGNVVQKTISELLPYGFAF
jgi:cytidine deaminase